MLGLDGVELLTAQQFQRGLPVDGDVMERVSQYLVALDAEAWVRTRYPHWACMSGIEVKVAHV